MDALDEEVLIKEQTLQYDEWRRRWWFRTTVLNMPHPDGWSGPLISISNHIGLLDHFRIFISLPKEMYLKLVPIRFIAKTDWSSYSPMTVPPMSAYLKQTYERNRVISVSDWADGGYTETRSALARGHVVHVYPEGHRRWTRMRLTGDKREIGRFKMGVVHLYRGTGIPIWPIAIRRRGTSHVVNWAPKPIRIPQPLSPKEACEWLRERILDLYEAME